MGEIIVDAPGWQERELAWIRRLQAVVRYPLVLPLLALVSRLADGVIWYVLILALPVVAGDVGWRCDWRMLAVGITNLALYYPLKCWAGRPRPFAAASDIRPALPALDIFSFPSGHTMHAVAFSLVLAHFFPLALLPLAAFAFLVAVSRVALGLHYPSDVAIGALIGMVTATAFSVFLAY